MRTRSEIWAATSLPEAMATLQSASFRASTSLTPSPGHGHRVLVALQGLDQKLFLIGLHPAEDVVLLAGGFDVLIGLQGGGIT